MSSWGDLPGERERIERENTQLERTRDSYRAGSWLCAVVIVVLLLGRLGGVW